MNQTTSAATAKVEIYSSHRCGYCIRAKALLDKKNVPYTEYFIDDQPALLPLMIERAEGRRTVPQIFINDRPIGGCDDLYQLEMRGMLDRLLGRGEESVEMNQ
jgi:glutaredoxin 3